MGGVWNGALPLLLACAGPDPLAQALGQDGPYAVVAYTSAGPPDWRWARAERPLAHGLSSMGLHDEDGGLALTGLPMASAPTWWEEQRRDLAVWGLRSEPGLTRARAADPAAWRVSRWPLEDPEAVSAIDPQRFEGAFWYYAAEGTQGDPAHATGPHRLRASPPAQARWTGEGLADPSPVRFHGERLVFATAWPEAVVLGVGEPPVEAARWSGVTVPYAAVVPGAGGEVLWLLAQAVVAGKRQPVRAISLDGRTFSGFSPFLDLGPLPSCTSPVLARLADGYALYCVVEP